MHRSSSFGSNRSKILLMSSEFSARRKHSYASIGSRVMGDSGSGIEVGDNRLEGSEGEALSIVIGIIAGEFSNESSL